VPGCDAAGEVVDAVVVAPVSAEVSMALAPPWLEQAAPSVTTETKESSFRMKVSSGCRGSPLRRCAAVRQARQPGERVGSFGSEVDGLPLGYGDGRYRAPVMCTRTSLMDV
jgi:hypothetical protein